MKKVIVNGRACRVTSFDGRRIDPGIVIGQLEGRRVYRVLCLDGDDVIARNVRHENILEAFRKSEVLNEFGIVEAI